MFPELGTKIGFHLPEVHRWERSTGASIDLRFASDNVRPKRFREATIWLTQLALEELDDRLWEVEGLCAIKDILFAERIGGHPLRKVAYYLGRGCNFDDITALSERSSRIEESKKSGPYQQVRFNILSLDLRPLSAQTQLGRLELPAIPQFLHYSHSVRVPYHEVGILPTGHLMLEHTRIRSANVGLEAGVQLPNLGPVQVKGLDISVSDAGAKSGLFQGHANRTHRRLRGETGHAYQLLLISTHTT
jgi:hypothetical protein